MCILCDQVKRQHRGYTFCPHCGSNLKNGFIPNFIIKRKISVDEYGRTRGLSTDTLIDIRINGGKYYE